MNDVDSSNENFEMCNIDVFLSSYSLVKFSFHLCSCVMLILLISFLSAFFLQGTIPHIKNV